VALPRLPFRPQSSPLTKRECWHSGILPAASITTTSRRQSGFVSRWQQMQPCGILNNGLSRSLVKAGKLAHLAGWANKLAGVIARIAAILHITATIGEGNVPATISREITEAAIRIGRDYLLPHALSAFAIMGATPNLAEAKRVLLWLGNSV